MRAREWTREGLGDELVALRQRLLNLGGADVTAWIDERTQAVHVRFDIFAELQHIGSAIETLLSELVGPPAWTLSGFAYYCA